MRRDIEKKSRSLGVRRLRVDVCRAGLGEGRGHQHWRQHADRQAQGLFLATFSAHADGERGPGRVGEWHTERSRVRRVFRCLRIGAGPRRSPSIKKEKKRMRRRRHADRQAQAPRADRARGASERGAASRGGGARARPPRPRQVSRDDGRLRPERFFFGTSAHADGERRESVSVRRYLMTRLARTSPMLPSDPI